MRKEWQNMVVDVLFEGAWCNIDLLDGIGGCAPQGSFVGFLHTLRLHIDRP